MARLKSTITVGSSLNQNTGNMPNQFKVTVNTNPDTEVEIREWKLEPTDTVKEPNRVSVEVGGLSYSLVFREDKPGIEVWSLDNEKELKDIIAHFHLPSSLPIISQK